MTSATEPSPPHRAARSRRLQGWRIATPLAFALTGVIFVVSARDSEGTDLRPGRYEDMASLVKTESDRVNNLKRQAATLQRQVDGLAASVDKSDVRRLRQLADSRRAAAGFLPVTGSALRITLSDAPAEVINSSNEDLKWLIVHQQDIQAVVNALWAGGAEGITVQGQRIISTTGIKCEGNSVQFDGVLYGQPYEIVAVGDLGRMGEALDADAAVQQYIADSRKPDVAVGWDLALAGTLTLPAYSGLHSLNYAKVAG